MANFHVLTGTGERVEFPAIQRIGMRDLGAALAAGWNDFWRKPSHLVFLGLIYPLVGGFLAAWSSGANAWPTLFPLISGFALLGPVAALPIYEMSRRQERGLDTDWLSALQVLRSPAMPSIIAVGIMLLLVFTAWLMVAQFYYESLFGPGSPASLTAFAGEVFGTAEGSMLMLWGNLIGLGFAALVLATTVITVPLLLDRDVGAAIAVQTSVRATLANPLVIAAWGVIVALLLLAGSIPILVGLAVVVPILGHATWHLYRRIVVPSPEADP